MTRKQKKNKRCSFGDVMSTKEIRTFAKRNGIKRPEDKFNINSLIREVA